MHVIDQANDMLDMWGCCLYVLALIYLLILMHHVKW
jgi:hypothetical protein